MGPHLERALYVASGVTSSCLPPLPPARDWKTSAERPFCPGRDSIHATAERDGFTFASDSPIAEERTRSVVIGDGHSPYGTVFLAWAVDICVKARMQRLSIHWQEESRSPLTLPHFALRTARFGSRRRLLARTS